MVRARLRVALLLATAAVTALVVLAIDPHGASQPGRAEQAATASSCADDLLLAVPGGDEGGSVHPAKVGVTAGLFTNAYQSADAAAGQSVRLSIVDYLTKNASVLRPKAHPLKPASTYVTKSQAQTWRTGVAAASDRAYATLVAANSTCPQQNIVLVGYSQGAMVVHRTLLAVAPHPSIANRITGALLISDGDRSKNTKARLAGTPAAARTARGIDDTRIAHFADVPSAAIHGTVISMCRKGDVVCNYGPTPAATAIKLSRTYHSGADAAAITKLARGLSVRSQRIPRPVPVADSVSTTVNTPVSKHLVADVLPVNQANLRWAKTSGMPPGLTLESNGLLHGVPTIPGTWTLRYTVRNSVDPLYARPVPGSVTFTATPSTAASLSAGGQDTCVVKENGTLYCWGLNTWGQVGDRTKTNRTVPTRVGTGTTWASVSTSGSHTCAINKAGSLYCWGLNNYGQLGDTTRTSNLAPRLVGGTTVKWLTVSTNWFQTCAITTLHTAYCWGLNADGQIGDGTKTTRLKPRRIGTDANWATISAGGWHTCATRTTGTLWCWGANNFGQLGDGTTTARSTPVQVGSATTWARASAGWMHTCGFTATGFALCWGFNSDGQNGIGTTATQLRPVNIGLAGPWVDISVGDGFSCGVRGDHTTWCWGNNTVGQLGIGTRTDQRSPVQVGGMDSMSISNGYSHTCAIATSGGTECWGVNDAGQLGDATNTMRLTPTPVSGG
jgi:alpha-tubulin suppressor-like RCC1 family protein